jgi:hypothetical protein
MLNVIDELIQRYVKDSHLSDTSMKDIEQKSMTGFNDTFFSKQSVEWLKIHYDVGYSVI